jgi:phospholipase/carboxylesterase
MHNPVVIEDLNGQKKAEFCIIWMHGLGANGHDFESIIPELKTGLAIKYIFPNAPQIPVTINNNMVMPAWFDIRNSSSISEDMDWRGIQQSENYINKLIQQVEQEGFASKNTLLIGFSQGGVIAYRVALQSKKPLAGIIALSSYLPLKGTENIQQPTNIPILIAHGIQDQVVPFILADDAKQKLTKLNYQPQPKNYPTEHQFCHQEIVDMAEFIKKSFKQEI